MTHPALIPLCEHPSNLDVTAVLKSPANEHRFTIYQCRLGFAVVIDPPEYVVSPTFEAIEGFFPTLAAATTAALEVVEA
jgi:hypothetical protein